MKTACLRNVVFINRCSLSLFLKIITQFWQEESWLWAKDAQNNHDFYKAYTALESRTICFTADFFLQGVGSIKRDCKEKEAIATVELGNLLTLEPNIKSLGVETKNMLDLLHMRQKAEITRDQIQ